jgi:hypothetical protein
MPRTSALFLALLISISAFAADRTPADVALLVRDEGDPSAALTAALASPVALSRATAARVALVRNTTAVLPAVRAALEHETDATAAREELRALVILGSAADVDVAIAAAKKWPSSIDAAVADAVARREDSIELYLTKLRELRQRPGSSFFTVALWRHPERNALAGSRLIAAHDDRAWKSLLDVLRQSHVAMNAGVLAASLDDPSEELRTASVWYLVRGYAADPSLIGEPVRNALAQPKEVASNREGFARELLRRMLGSDKKDDPRWLQWLRSDEANRTFANEELAVYDWFTDAEYEARRNECGQLPHECAMPAKRQGKPKIASSAVAPPDFTLLNALPAGLADAIVAGRCRGGWLGLASATVDPAGRVQRLDLSRLSVPAPCAAALDAMLKLSLATNVSLKSPLSSDQVLLVHAGDAPMCLDEDAPSEVSQSGLQRVGGRISAPKVIKRVEPDFPESARRSMGGGSDLIMILEAVISKSGCVRSVRPLLQSPFGELNAAALRATAQWRFSPALLDGDPVDVIFNLTIHYMVKR